MRTSNAASEPTAADWRTACHALSGGGTSRYLLSFVGGLCVGRAFWQQCQAEPSADTADAIVEAQKFESRDSGARDEHGCQVNGVEGPNRVARKRLPCAVHDLRPDAEDVPVRCGRGQVGAAVCDLRFRKFTQRCRPMEDAVAFNEGEVRREHDRGLRQRVAHDGACRFVQQPREYSA